MVCARLILASATFLVFLPEPHGQGAFLPILGPIRLYVQEMVAGFLLEQGFQKYIPHTKSLVIQIQSFWELKANRFFFNRLKGIVDAITL